jgi:hypothetical protein
LQKYEVSPLSLSLLLFAVAGHRIMIPEIQGLGALGLALFISIGWLARWQDLAV